MVLRRRKIIHRIAAIVLFLTAGNAYAELKCTALTKIKPIKQEQESPLKEHPPIVTRTENAKAIPTGTETFPFVVKAYIPPITDKELAWKAKKERSKALHERWLYWFAIISGISTFAIAILNYFLWRSTNNLWIASNKQSEDMQNSIGEAKRSADAMEKVALTIQNNSMNQIRAYLSVHFIQGTWQHDTIPIQFKLLIKNTGFTPAHDIKVKTSSRFLDFPNATLKEFIYERGSLPIGYMAYSQEHPITHTHSKIITKDEINEGFYAIDSGKALYVYGTVTYTDIYKVNHKTNFCKVIIWRDDNNDCVATTFDLHNDAD